MGVVLEKNDTSCARPGGFVLGRRYESDDEMQMDGGKSSARTDRLRDVEKTSDRILEVRCGFSERPWRRVGCVGMDTPICDQRVLGERPL